MKKNYAKKVLAITMATTMVIGGSMTALAETSATSTVEGTATSEGNAVGFTAPSVTVPTSVTAAAYTYIADPNGLIKESGSSRYANAEWASTAKGIFFQTDTNKYSEKSKAIEITNESAYALDVSVTMTEKSDQKAKNITYTTDNTFKDSTDKQVYFALSAGKEVATMTTKDSATVPATLNVSIAGKPSNFELKWNTDKYEYQAIANPTWNKTEVVATGYLNEAAEWISGDGDKAIVFPALSITYNISAGAAPVKIASGAPATVNLTKKGASLTIAKIDYNGTLVPANMYEVATAATASAGTVLTLKSGFTSFAYGKTPADGLNFTVTYSDDSEETFTVYKK